MASATMEEKGSSSSPTLMQRARRMRTIAITLTIIFTGYFLVESMLYRGFSAWLSEWQFDKLGQAVPVFTLAALVIVFSLPAWLIYAVMLRRARKASPPEAEVEPTLAHWVARANRFKKLLDGAATILLILAVLSFAWGAIVAGTARQVRLSPSAQNGTGPAGERVVGVVDPRLSVSVANNLIFFNADTRYAPVIEPGQARALRYFVELPADPRDPHPDFTHPLLEVKGQLPGAVVALYRKVGYNVPRDRYVLSPSMNSVQLPYRIGAGQLLIGAIIAFVIGRLQRRRITRITKKTEPDL